MREVLCFKKVYQNLVHNLVNPFCGGSCGNVVVFASIKLHDANRRAKVLHGEGEIDIVEEDVLKSIRYMEKFLKLSTISSMLQTFTIYRDVINWTKKYIRWIGFTNNQFWVRWNHGSGVHGRSARMECDSIGSCTHAPMCCIRQNSKLTADGIRIVSV